MTKMTCGEALIGLLKTYGVDTVFGIPGVHTLEFYRGLDRHGIRHVTTRHEQGAAFMADGYARATGLPGVCLVISGPGVTNAATALGEAYSDSVPVLMISSVQGTTGMGLGRGELHEVTSQQATTAALTGFSATALTENHIPELIARAFASFASTRPRPGHIEVPLDVLSQPATFTLETRVLPAPPAPNPKSIAAATELLAAAERPVMLVGGGANGHGDAVVRLAERIGAAVVHSRAGKGVMPEDHPLCLGASIRLDGTQEFLRAADVVLAVATEMAPADHWLERLDIRGELVRIDIDAAVLTRDYPVAVPVHGDVGIALDGLLAALGGNDSAPNGFAAGDRLDQVRRVNTETRTSKQRKHARVLKALRAVLPRDAFVAADSTQLAYSGTTDFPCYRDRSWLFPVGYGTLGFALPAGIGAKLATPDRPGAVIIGDGGILFTVGDLSTAVEQQLSLPVIVWNNSGYGQIRDDMNALGYPNTGVDLKNPDFVALAKSFGCEASRPADMGEFEEAVRGALSHPTPTIIEVHEDSAFLRSGED